jgi:hypothetical protein
MMPVVHFFQSLSFTQCTILLPFLLAFLVFIMPWVRNKLGIEVAGEMSDSANEAFGAIALFFVFIAASSLTTVQGFQKDGQKVTEVELAHITNLDRELVRIDSERAVKARLHLKSYMTAIIEKEWKTMEHGLPSDEVEAALGQLISTVNHMEEDKKVSEKMLESLEAHIEKVSDSRDERIQVSNLHLSFIYWDMIFAFIGILIVISFFYHTAVPKRIGLSGKMIALAFTLVLILQTDGVFYGDISIKPDAYSASLAKMKIRTMDTASSPIESARKS